ncbi:MAG TPA: kelch repeat-containing protein [bacterium]
MKAQLFVLILILGLVTLTSAQPGRDVVWTQMQSAPYPFAYAGCGVLGNYFYCFGTDLSAPHAQAFNLMTEQWYESTLPPYGWTYCGSATTDSAIYLIGHAGPSGPEVQKFTPISGGPTGIWTQMAAYPFPAWGIAAAWDGGNYIYTAGGMEPPMHNEAYRYDIANNTWTQIASMPVPMAYCGGAFVQDRFYVVGGWTTASMLFEYNPANNTWTSKTGPPTAVQLPHASTTSNDSLVFVIGGGSISMNTNAVQVYNPLTDTWTQETPLPEAYHSNSARFVPPDKVISAGGADATGQLTAVTYLGTGFPSGSPPATLSITLSAINPPIVIPAGGGSFNFNVALINNTTGAQTFDVWIMIGMPSGVMWGPALGPISLTMPSYGTLVRVRTQSIPGRAPAGSYQYIGYVGDYPSVVEDSSYFTFTKSADLDGGSCVGDWSCTGEEIAPEVGAHNVRPSGSGTTPTMEILPNPFNPSAVLSYQLPVASRVSLRVYDTAGRLVTELVNGWRDAGAHQITFDGSGLPSGLYFAKLKAGDYTQAHKLVLMK